MQKTSTVSIVGALVWCFWVHAGAGAQEERWKALFEDRVDVRVVDIEVFVSDQDGRPVTGLRSDDFQLTENGQLVEISNFFAVEGGPGLESGPRPVRIESPSAAQASEPEPRDFRLIFFVDNENITPAHRKSVFKQARELVLQHRRPDVQMMVVTRDRSAVGASLHVLQGFTTVAHELFVALDELESRGAEGAARVAERRRLARAIDYLQIEAAAGLGGGKNLSPMVLTMETEVRNLLPQVQAYGEQRFRAARRTLATLGEVVDLVAAWPDRKALVYVSDGLSLQPGAGLLEALVNRVAILPALAGEISAQSEAARFDTTRDVSRLVDRANASKVVIYAIDASPPDFVARGAADFSGSFRGRQTGATMEESQDSLIFMAESTGGRVGLTASGLSSALEGIYTDFDHYYSLGFTVSLDTVSLDDGQRERSIEVAIPGKDYRVRYRRGFRFRTSEEQMRHKVLSALVLGEATAEGGAEESNPLGMTLRPPQIKSGEGATFRVRFSVEVPLARLVLVPGKFQHEAPVSLYVAARDGLGRTSPVARHLCPVRVKNSEILVALGRSMVCSVSLALRGGQQQVAVALRDETSKVESLELLTLDVRETVAEDTP